MIPFRLRFNGRRTAAGRPGSGLSVIIDTSPEGGEYDGATPVTLNVSATDPLGGTLAYQWQQNTGSGWSNIAMATASSYDAAPGTSGTQYRVLVSTDSPGVASLYSNPATVTFAAPNITADPEGGTATVTLSVTATGAGLSYQWHCGGDNNGGFETTADGEFAVEVEEIDVLDASVFLVGDVLAIENGPKERVLVTDINGNTLTVTRGYDGTTAGSIAEGDAFTLFDRAISGATNDSYAANPDATLDYWVVVSNVAGEDTSAVATVEPGAWFLDEFGGSASDPALDATKWTQRVRTGGGGDLGDGSSSVNAAQAGKMVCQRVSGGSYGVFAGFITAQEPAEDLVISFKLQIDQNAPNNWNELRFKCTDKLANGVTDGPANGYVVQLDMGTACQVRRHDAGWPGTQIGSTFDAGFTLGVSSDVIVTVSVLADRVRIVVNVDGVDKITAEDTSGSRITAAGYSGICLESSTNSAHHTILDDFSVAAA